MQSIKSGVSVSYLSDLKSLLELISDPKKLSSLVDDIKSDLEELKKSEQASTKLLKDLSIKEGSLMDFQKELSNKELSIKDAMAANSAALKQINTKESELSAKEKSFMDKVSEFNLFKEKETASLLEKQKLADEKYALASELEKTNFKLKSQLEDKLNQIRSLAG